MSSSFTLSTNLTKTSVPPKDTRINNAKKVLSDGLTTLKNKINKSSSSHPRKRRNSFHVDEAIRFACYTFFRDPSYRKYRLLAICLFLIIMGLYGCILMMINFTADYWPFQNMANEWNKKECSSFFFTNPIAFPKTFSSRSVFTSTCQDYQTKYNTCYDIQTDVPNVYSLFHKSELNDTSWLLTGDTTLWYAPSSFSTSIISINLTDITKDHYYGCILNPIPSSTRFTLENTRLLEIHAVQDQIWFDLEVSKGSSQRIFYLMLNPTTSPSFPFLTGYFWRPKMWMEITLLTILSTLCAFFIIGIRIFMNMCCYYKYFKNRYSIVPVFEIGDDEDLQLKLDGDENLELSLRDEEL